MKNLFLTIAIVAFGFVANAQDGQFNVGANIGLPIGDSSDGSSFVIGAEANYLFDLSDEFKVGPSVGYSHFIGKTVNGVDIPSSSFLPLAAAARYSVSEAFVLGADLGYGLGLSPDGNDGGFYYRPMVGYNVSDMIMVQLTYSGVSVNGGTASNVGLGAMFSL